MTAKMINRNADVFSLKAGRVKTATHSEFETKHSDNKTGKDPSIIPPAMSHICVLMTGLLFCLIYTSLISAAMSQIGKPHNFLIAIPLLL